MLSQAQPLAVPSLQDPASAQHQYPTRRSITGATPGDLRSPDQHAPVGAEHAGVSDSAAQLQKLSAPKNVTFELHFDGAPNVRGRLPMRVSIWPHDTTDSIVTTVKNFYGLYDGASQGVSFEDPHGHTLIASYENFSNDMTVYVRVTADYAQAATPHRPEYPAPWEYGSTSPQRELDHGDTLNQMPPPQGPNGIAVMGTNGPMPPSRPGSRISRKQSASPHLSSGRSASAQKPRMRSGMRGPGSSFHGDDSELINEQHNGYSSSDCGAGSVTSSRKARSEQLASAEISVENIVEGGRRKKPKFSSSVRCPKRD